MVSRPGLWEMSVLAVIRAQLALVVVGLTTFLILGAAQALIGPGLPEFEKIFALSEGTAAVILSAQWIGSAIGITLMYRFGARLSMRHALLLMLVGAAAIAVLAGWWLALIGAALFGMGSGLATATMNPRFLHAFGPRGPAMLGLLNATYGIGAILSPLAFVAMGNRPGPAFWAVSFGCFLVWLAALAGLARVRTAPRITPVATSPTPGRFRPPFALLGFAVFGVGIEACMGGLGPSALIAAGKSEPVAAELLSAFFIAFVCARFVLVLVAQTVPSFVLFTLAMGWTALAGFAGTMLPPELPFIAMGAAAGLFFPTFYVTASRLMPDDPRTPPVIIAAGLVGGIVGPVVIAPLSITFGERGFFWIIGGIAAVVTLVALIAMPRILRAVQPVKA